ncbi:uncharacterized protein SCHCODRAFT_02504947 [Schizophyllum commune H4-8]|nr:uncharacterized protein SCHCODRAFT_02504947 [Schizophyllum commune H4-8]KAI5891011.1 hypothetical protein SCHCODRAFT_02504947 [Schizophyllum commune H4-8]
MPRTDLIRSRIKQLASLLTVPSGFPDYLLGASSGINSSKPFARCHWKAWLGEFTWIPKDEEPLLRDSILHCIRPRSGFMDWLELLLPQNGHFTHVPLEIFFLCTDVLALLHGLEVDLALDITQAARLHILVFKMWLDPPSLDAFRSSGKHEQYHDRVTASLVFMMGKVLSRHEQTPSAKSRARDGIIEALLIYSGHRPRRLFRHFVRSTTRILMTPIDPTRCAERYIFFIRCCIANYIVIQNHARDVVRDLVAMVRFIGRRFGDRGHGAACEACGVLYQIWYTEKDSGSRALCWALRAGILPLILSLRRQGSDDSLTTALNFIAERSISVPVARALRVGGYGISCAEAGIPEPLATALTECFVERPSLQQRLMGRNCSYEECPAGPSAIHSRVYRCTCFKNYCSAACHQADWPEHKKDRHAPDLPSGPQEIVLEGELTSSDAYFTMLCADSYFCAYVAQLLDEARQLPLPKDATLQPLYTIKLDFTVVPMRHYISVAEGEEYMTEPMVNVLAGVNSSVGRWHVAIVDVHIEPLSALYNMTLGVI